MHSKVAGDTNVDRKHLSEAQHLHPLARERAFLNMRIAKMLSILNAIAGIGEAPCSPKSSIQTKPFTANSSGIKGRTARVSSYSSSDIKASSSIVSRSISLRKT